MKACGKCGSKLGDNATHFAVRVGAQWIATFKYPPTPSNVDKAWAASEGLSVAPACKAILGDTPFTWTGEANAAFIAERTNGEVVGLCAGCGPAETKVRRRQKRVVDEEDE